MTEHLKDISMDNNPSTTELEYQTFYELSADINKENAEDLMNAIWWVEINLTYTFDWEEYKIQSISDLAEYLEWWEQNIVADNDSITTEMIVLLKIFAKAYYISKDKTINPELENSLMLDDIDTLEISNILDNNVLSILTEFYNENYPQVVDDTSSKEDTTIVIEDDSEVSDSIDVETREYIETETSYSIEIGEDGQVTYYDKDGNQIEVIDSVENTLEINIQKFENTTNALSIFADVLRVQWYKKESQNVYNKMTEIRWTLSLNDFESFDDLKTAMWKLIESCFVDTTKKEFVNYQRVKEIIAQYAVFGNEASLIDSENWVYTITSHDLNGQLAVAIRQLTVDKFRNPDRTAEVWDLIEPLLEDYLVNSPRVYNMNVDVWVITHDWKAQRESEMKELSTDLDKLTDSFFVELKTYCIANDQDFNTMEKHFQNILYYYSDEKYDSTKETIPEQFAQTVEIIRNKLTEYKTYQKNLEIDTVDKPLQLAFDLVKVIQAEEDRWDFTISQKFQKAVDAENMSIFFDGTIWLFFDNLPKDYKEELKTELIEIWKETKSALKRQQEEFQKEVDKVMEEINDDDLEWITKDELRKEIFQSINDMFFAWVLSKWLVNISISHYIRNLAWGNSYESEAVEVKWAKSWLQNLILSANVGSNMDKWIKYAEAGVPLRINGTLRNDPALEVWMDIHGRRPGVIWGIVDLSDENYLIIHSIIKEIVITAAVMKLVKRLTKSAMLKYANLISKAWKLTKFSRLLWKSGTAVSSFYKMKWLNTATSMKKLFSKASLINGFKNLPVSTVDLLVKSGIFYTWHTAAYSLRDWVRNWEWWEARKHFNFQWYAETAAFFLVMEGFSKILPIVDAKLTAIPWTQKIPAKLFSMLKWWVSIWLEWLGMFAAWEVVELFFAEEYSLEAPTRQEVAQIMTMVVAFRGTGKLENFVKWSKIKINWWTKWPDWKITNVNFSVVSQKTVDKIDPKTTNKIRKQIKNTESKQIQKNETTIEQNKQEIEKLIQENSEIQKVINQKQTKISQLKKDQAKQKLQNEIDDLQTKINNNNDRIAELTNKNIELKAYEEQVALIHQHEKLLEQISKRQSEKQEAENKKAENDTKIQELTTKKEELQKEIQELEIKKKEQADKEDFDWAANTKAEIQSKQEELQNLENQINSIKNESTESITKEIENLEKQAKELETQINIEIIRKDLANNIKKLSEIENKKTENDTKIQDITTQKEQIQKDIQELEVKKKEQANKEEFDLAKNTKAEIETKQKELENLENQIKELWWNESTADLQKTINEQQEIIDKRDKLSKITPESIWLWHNTSTEIRNLLLGKLYSAKKWDIIKIKTWNKTEEFTYTVKEISQNEITIDIVYTSPSWTVWKYWANQTIKIPKDVVDLWKYFINWWWKNKTNLQNVEPENTTNLSRQEIIRMKTEKTKLFQLQTDMIFEAKVDWLDGTFQIISNAGGKLKFASKADCDKYKVNNSDNSVKIYTINRNGTVDSKWVHTADNKTFTIENVVRKTSDGKVEIVEDNDIKKDFEQVEMIQEKLEPWDKLIIKWHSGEYIILTLTKIEIRADWLVVYTRGNHNSSSTLGRDQLKIGDLKGADMKKWYEYYKPKIEIWTVLSAEQSEFITRLLPKWKQYTPEQAKLISEMTPNVQEYIRQWLSNFRINWTKNKLNNSEMKNFLDILQNFPDYKNKLNVLRLRWETLPDWKLPDFIWSIQNLEILDLANSNISNINWVSKMNLLIELNFNSCTNIKSLPAEIKNIPTLKYLELWSNMEISEIPVELLQNKNLTISKDTKVVSKEAELERRKNDLSLESKELTDKDIEKDYPITIYAQSPGGNTFLHTSNQYKRGSTTYELKVNEETGEWVFYLVNKEGSYEDAMSRRDTVVLYACNVPTTWFNSHQYSKIKVSKTRETMWKVVKNAEGQWGIVRKATPTQFN